MLASLLASVIATASPGTAPSMISTGLICASTVLAPTQTGLLIDTSALHEAGAGQAVAQQLRSRTDVLFLPEQEGTHSNAPPRLTRGPLVMITVQPLPRSEIGYESTISLERGAQGYASEFVELRCDLCTEGELITQLSDALRLLISTDDLAR
ncbi:MAG TPA: hypothetical protein ENK31_03100 [Nannocystis exedens]|nr:hypothetical protein [Nannocystis exedens]